MASSDCPVSKKSDVFCSSYPPGSPCAVPWKGWLHTPWTAYEALEDIDCALRGDGEIEIGYLVSESSHEVAEKFKLTGDRTQDEFYLKPQAWPSLQHV